MENMRNNESDTHLNAEANMSFEEFTNLAIRTESVVEEASVDIPSFKSLLEMFVIVGTLLDYTKKGIFYNNYSKYDDNYVSLVQALNDKFLEFVESSCDGERVQQKLDYRLIHGLLGAITESSEIAEHLISYLDSGAVDKAGILEECGDSDWYKAILFDHLNISENTSRTNVIEKLKVRFPDKYSDDAAANRNLSEERKKLENNVA